MNKQELITVIRSRLEVNRAARADHVNTARTMDTEHNVYTELVDYHHGKICAFETVLEMLEDTQ